MSPRRKPASPTSPRQCWPVEQWPAKDREAWAQALAPGDPFAPGELGAGWSTATRRQIAVGYGRWLAWLHRQGWLDPLVPPAERATKERVRAYARELQETRSPFSVQGRIQELGDALRVMTSDMSFRWISRAAGRLRSQARPVKDKRSRLQSPARLAELGLRLMELAQREVVTLESAVNYRDGLVIALLAYRPLRARNLAMIACEEHLVQRDGVWRLLFTDRQTKSGRRHETPFPAELVPRLERYLGTYRALLLTKGGQQAPAPVTALWVSRDATALGYGTIAHHVRKHTRAAFGVAMTPHLFRDAAATAIAVHDPEHVNNIMPVLGHSTLATSERHYNQARGLEAGRRFQANIAKLRTRTTLPSK
jgi:integrase/recombinase XerD